MTRTGLALLLLTSVALAADPLPNGAVARIGSGRFRVGEPHPAALTPDGKHLLVGHLVLDAACGLEVGRVPDTLPDGGTVGGFILSADGRTAFLFVSPKDGNAGSTSIVAWDVGTQKIGKTLKHPPEAGPRFRAAAVAPDGTKLLSCDSSRNVTLWTDLDSVPKSVALGKTEGGGHSDGPRFTPDGKFALDVGPAVRVWDAATGKLAREFAGPKGVTFRWTLTPDGKQLAVISGEIPPQDKEKKPTAFRVSLWDFEKGTETRQLADRLSATALNSGETLRLLFTPDGRTVVVIDDDREKWEQLPVRRWTAADGKSLPDWTMPRPTGYGNTPLVSPDGETLYHVSLRGVRTFDLNTGEDKSPEDLRAGGGSPIGLTADDKQLVMWRGQGKIAFWEVETGKLLREEKIPKFTDVFSMHFTPDAKLVAVDTRIGPNNDRDTVVYERASGKELYRLRGERCGTFGPDGTHLFTLSPSYKTTSVREAETGKVLHSLPCQGNDKFFFSPDGKVVSRPWQMNTHGFDTTTGKAVFDGKEFMPDHLKPRLAGGNGWPKGPADDIRALAVGPEGKRFAVAGRRQWYDGDKPPTDRVLVFDTAGKKLLWEVTTEAGKWIDPSNYHAAAFSPDGTVLAVGGKRTLLLFDAATGKQLRKFDGHNGRVDYVQFTRDGKRLLSADGDGTVWVWDAAAR